MTTIATKVVVTRVETLTVLETDRRAVRAEVVNVWLREEPGEPNKRNAYRYDVETLADGTKIYVTRPTRLNKGMDFVIHCEGFTKFKNGNDKPPKHADLIAELQPFLTETARASGQTAELRMALSRIWRCERPEQVVESLQALKGSIAVERILKVARWFFIEQDLTYWTDSGRWMLRAALEEYLGVFPSAEE
jgi:hypothetical protein